MDWKRRSGEVLTAATWNSVIDRIKKEIQSGGLVLPDLDHDRVRIKNVSGTDLDLGMVQVVQQYSGPNGARIQEFAQSHVLETINPLVTHPHQRLVFTAEPIRANELGWAVVSGVTVLQVQQNDSLDGRVGLNSGNTRIGFSQKSFGFGKIIEWIDTQWAIVVVPTDEDPWMRFRANAKIVNRRVAVTIERVQGQIYNPATNLVYKEGDVVNVHDPTNLWGEIETNATGTAFYNRQNDRWDIETASLPIKRIRAKVEDCLKYTDGSKVAKFGSANGYPDFILSSYPAADLPPEVTTNGPGDYQLTFQNEYKLDAVPDSEVVLERRTNVQISDPGNYDAPKPSSATTTKWVAVQRFEQIARYAVFVKSGGNWNLVAWYEGADPTPCNPTVSCLFPCECLDDGDNALGFYDPQANEYRLHSTQSALLGPPDDITAWYNLTWDANNCYLKAKSQAFKAWKCEAQPADEVVPLPTTAINSITGLYANGSSICATYQTVLVVGCQYAGSGQWCVDICDILCLCEEIYSLPDVCDPPPPPPCTCCDCFFVQGVTALSITWTSASNETHVSIDIQPTSQPCEWLAVFDDQAPGPPDTRTWTIRYDCTKWTAGGAWPGSISNGTPMELSGDGDCGGATLNDAGNNPADASGVVTTDGAGIECDPPVEGCCQTWSGDEYVQSFVFRDYDDYSGAIVEGVHPIQTGGNGNCKKTASAPAMVTNENTGNECSVTVTFELNYDTDVGSPGNDLCRWHYTIPPCQLTDPNGQNPPEDFPGDGGAVPDCLASNCNAAGGQCGDGIGGAGFQDAQLTIQDPDNSVTGCVGPPVPGQAGQSAGARYDKVAQRPVIDFAAATHVRRPRTPADLLDAAGNHLAHTTASRPLPPSRFVVPPTHLEEKEEGLGDRFAAENPDLMRGCTSCSSAVPSRMNAWEFREVEETDVQAIARTISSKHPEHDQADLVELIWEFLAKNGKGRP